MGILIEIRRYLQRDNIFYYKVTEDFETGKSFYISVDMNKKKIIFYRSAECSDPVKEIDLENLDNNKEDFGDLNKKLNTTRVGKVFVKAYKAFKKNEFPECLDYAA